MSKKNTSSTVPRSEPMTGYMYWPYQASTLEGKLLTFVESLGFRETQEKAVKDIVRGIFYEFYKDVMYVEGEKAQAISREYYDRRNNQQVINSR